MQDGQLLTLNARDVAMLLAEREHDIMDIVRQAYLIHGQGDSALPHSNFLRFPQQPADRIIALPAYLGGHFQVSGIKWIASFPNNAQRNYNRASALTILNSMETGMPYAILEGSIISAKRTAASAALGAQYLHGDRPLDQIGLVGCGPINFEIFRFLHSAFPTQQSFTIFDLDYSRAEQFKAKCQQLLPHARLAISPQIDQLLATCQLVSFATTAAAPHIADLPNLPGRTILHISLRDLAPEVLLACDNIVDDIDHVSRAQTSVHLTEQLVQNRTFINGTLADVIQGSIPARTQPNRTVVFSPFGLGILDLAVGHFVFEQAQEQQRGTVLPSFLPGSWLDDQVTTI